ncbi:MAG TPA: sulfotransferase [Casimicrobiaceae bacterium]|nr:sulfotransferase [Casimicrobiaceae bacterium]
MSRVVSESPAVPLSGSASHDGAASAAPRRPPPLPVVVGCPRSGTSLLAVMLDSHPDLAVPPETAFVGLVARLSGTPAAVRQSFLDIVTADRIAVSNWSDFGLDKDSLRRRLETIEPFTVSEGLRAFYAMYAEGEGKPRYGEKTPDYVFFMPEIAALLPEAHFIHVIRDPGDTALSWRKTWFAPSQDLRVLGAQWRRRVDAGRRGSTLVRRYLEIRFEDLIRRTEETLKRVCAFVSLPWDPAMLDYGTRGAARLERLRGRRHALGPMIEREQRTRIHANLIRAPDAERLEVWRREMSPDERRALEDAAGPLVRELGYAA